MNYTISDKLPEVYWRKGKSYYLDPIRKKLIYITPEETVRQRVIMYLIEDLHVPTEQIISEQHLAHYALQLVVEDNLVAVGNKVSFYHHGKIAIGRQGSGKVDELRSFVEERYPQIPYGS